MPVISQSFSINSYEPPMAQDKLVRCTRGRVFDVAVDLRTGSPTRGQWVSLILDAATGNQILVPKGFGHAFQTLEPDCEVQYKVTAPYAPDCDRSIRWDDPAIGVDPGSLGAHAGIAFAQSFGFKFPAGGRLHVVRGEPQVLAHDFRIG